MNKGGRFSDETDATGSEAVLTAEFYSYRMPVIVVVILNCIGKNITDFFDDSKAKAY